MQLLKHVQIVVRGSAVGADADVDPLVKHPLNRGEAGAELHVAGRTVDRIDAVGLQNVHVVLRDPDAVGSRGPVAEGAELFK